MRANTHADELQRAPRRVERGFTLVEILIVIVIIGILATVTVFAVRGITDRGQTSSCDIGQRTLDTAIEAYYAENQVEPTVIGDLVPRYLAEDPTVGIDADFTFTGYSDGPDATPDTADDVPAAFTAINNCV